MGNEINSFKKPLYYVGIGASAGGLEALEDFFKNVPEYSGLAFIVVQHLSPDYKSMMVELLKRKTNIKVVEITDGMFPEANCIYLIPPQKNLTIFHSQLVLSEQIRGTSLNLPIDIFFRSLALDQNKNAVGIILSGTGSDGTLGIKAIKEQGGLIMVQDFSSAQFDGMPKSAISTGFVDYIVKTNIMCETLIKHINHPQILQTDDLDEDQNREEISYVKILSLVRTNTNIDFSYYKPKTILRRIERRISINQLEGYEDYIKLLLNSKEECETLSREFLIGVTQFFRDKKAYDIIEKDVIPKIFKKMMPKQPIRVWSVGCSTGEEAYSLAILFKEYMSINNIKADVKIFATDLGKEAIRVGGLGVYPQNIVADVSKELLNKYFTTGQDNFQVNEQIRQMVVFANHNVMTDPPFSKISLVVCRNLLIYFNNEIQSKVQNMFQYSLSQGGYMFLGSSESIVGNTNAFEVIDSKWKVFKYKDGYSNISLSNLILPKTRKNSMVSGIVKNNEAPFVKSDPLTKLYEKALNYLAPAGVIIDSQNNIIHFFKDIRRFLNFPEGKASFDLLELIDPQLTMILSNILFKVRKTKNEITMNRFKFKEYDNYIILNISAKIISDKKSSNEFVLIAIKENLDTEKLTDNNDNIEDFNYDEQVAEQIRDLEREIMYRDENLQTTIEELETSNEELQATNEELVSSNEELQSTNEELQSVNEELYTVNTQYQEKITELTEVHNDINNLLTNTNIGTLFLDGKLIIRKFTPEIKKTINIMDIDIGRPLSHISYNCDKTLLKNATRVLNTLIKEEVEVSTKDGSWFLMKIQPYRHSDNSIHGILITQINIDDLQKTRISNMKLSHALEQSVVGTLITDFNGNIEYVNQSYKNISGYDSTDLIGKNSRIFKSGIHNNSFYQELWKKIKKGEIWNGEICNKHKNGNLYWENVTISCIKNSEGEITSFLANKELITEKKERILEIKKLNSRLENSLKASDSAWWEMSLPSGLVKFSDNKAKMLGYEPERFKHYKDFTEIVHPDDYEITMQAMRDHISGVKPSYDCEYRIKNSDGEYLWFYDIGKIVQNKNGNIIITGIVKNITDLVIANKELKKQLEHNKSRNRDINLLINQLLYGFAYCELIRDKNGIAVDCKYVYTNKAFLDIIGLPDEIIVGKTVKQVIPNTEQSCVDIFAKVAVKGDEYSFEKYSEILKKTFVGTVYSPTKGFIIIVLKEKKGE